MFYLIGWLRQLPLLLLIVTGIVLTCIKKTRTAGKIILTVLITLAVAYVSLLAIVIIAFDSPDSGYYNTVLVCAVVIALVMIFGGIWGFLKKKGVWIPCVVGLVLCGIAAGGHMAYDKYVESIPVISDNFGSLELRELYAPYAEDTKVAVLEEEATLHISEDIPRLDGATALYPVYSAFARAVYPKELIDDITYQEGEFTRTNINEYLECTTTNDAYYNIVTGDVDIIFAAPPSDEQVQFAEENGVELEYTPIGKEAFVFFVNAKNPIDNISLEDVKKIYSGEIGEWKDLGVRGLGDIKAFQRNEGSGSQSALIRLMGDKELMTPPKEDVMMDMGGIVSITSDYKNHKNAIGYSFRFYSTEMVQNKQIKLLSINGVYPSLENIDNGTYPIASHFYAVTRKEKSENTKKLLEWILSEQGQSLIEKTGYTPITK